MDEVIEMTSGYGCEKRRKSGTVNYLWNQSSDKPSITTTGGEAKLHRKLCFLLAFLDSRNNSQVHENTINNSFDSDKLNQS